MKRLHVSWSEISRLCHTITENTHRPSHIVALSRGGLAPGVMLSHHWDVPLVPIRWSTRDHADCDLTTAVKILDIMSNNPNDRILIVDDIGDTGKSLATLTDFLYNNIVQNAKERITTACLFQKPGCAFDFDVAAETLPEDDVWVVFPFEEPLEEQ